MEGGGVLKFVHLMLVAVIGVYGLAFLINGAVLAANFQKNKALMDRLGGLPGGGGGGGSLPDFGSVFPGGAGGAVQGAGDIGDLISNLGGGDIVGKLPTGDLFPGSRKRRALSAQNIARNILEIVRENAEEGSRQHQLYFSTFITCGLLLLGAAGLGACGGLTGSRGALKVYATALILIFLLQVALTITLGVLKLKLQEAVLQGVQRAGGRAEDILQHLPITKTDPDVVKLSVATGLLAPPVHVGVALALLLARARQTGSQAA